MSQLLPETWALLTVILLSLLMFGAYALHRSVKAKERREVECYNKWCMDFEEVFHFAPNLACDPTNKQARGRLHIWRTHQLHAKKPETRVYWERKWRAGVHILARAPHRIPENLRPRDPGLPFLNKMAS